MKLKHFIPIECGIENDSRMSALINHTGPAGYGLYMILLIELRQHKNYSIDTETLKFIARKYSICRKLMEDVLYNYNLFTVENQADGSIQITSGYVTRVMQNYDEKVARSVEAGKTSADQEKVTETERPLNSVATTEHNRTEHNRTEEEEEKQEKEEATAVAPPPPLPLPLPFPLVAGVVITSGTKTLRRYRGWITHAHAPPNSS